MLSEYMKELNVTYVWGFVEAEETILVIGLVVAQFFLGKVHSFCCSLVCF